ncbi:putative B3 domain-containing protein Os03g0621600 [Wolffia australiana]
MWHLPSKTLTEASSSPRFLVFGMAKSKSNFFKIILADVDTQRLSLPRKFMAELKTQQLPETVELEDFADRRWPVKLKKTGSAVFLDEGWERFAAAHSLQPADFLLFSFTGGSRFTVIVFAPHGGEKQRRPPAQASIPATAQRRSDVKSERPPEKPTTVRPLVMPQCRRTHLKKLRERGALQAAQALTLSRPAFLTIVQPTHVSGNFRLGVPSKFAVEFMAGDEGRAVIKGNGGAWWVQYRRRCSKVEFATGWKLFVKENQLAVDDIVVFELSSSWECDIQRFHFTVFRAGDGLSVNSDQNVIEARGKG